ncbi:hypothetical protein CEUSTIGMA_g1894.t1 [Chlamydomonas eustigma]|uniref:Uncharacterized protein n=1 Tax=Chlamydomonas eustigma TaxID=1157962 RepID=A0A250WUG6_9CHLO|nr:hypothetical protein CEUSTIGMA_g1894.t1 [Chlamydomonas eustigma]|eukprot:GAX74445.1 hypothetical protein CEUSTIGMA_g1894.t1 [Chlamydomonas eustigma]
MNKGENDRAFRERDIASARNHDVQKSQKLACLSYLSSCNTGTAFITTPTDDTDSDVEEFILGVDQNVEATGALGDSNSIPWNSGSPVHSRTAAVHQPFKMLKLSEKLGGKTRQFCRSAPTLQGLIASSVACTAGRSSAANIGSRAAAATTFQRLHTAQSAPSPHPHHHNFRGVSPHPLIVSPAHHGLESLKPSDSPNSPCSSSKETTTTYTTTTSNCFYLHSLRRELLSQHVPHQSQPAEIIYPDRQDGQLPTATRADTDLLRESAADNGRLRSTRVHQPAQVSTLKLDLYLSAPAASLLQLMPQQYDSDSAHRGQRIKGLPSKSPGRHRCPVTLVKEPSSPPSVPQLTSALLPAVLLDTAEEKGATFDPRHAAAVGGGTSSCPTKGMPLLAQSHDSSPSSCLAHGKIPAANEAEGLPQGLDAGMEYSHFRQRQPFVSSTASESKQITPSPSFSDSLPSLQGTGKSSSSSSSIVTMGAAVKVQLRMEDSPLPASSLQDDCEPSSMVLPISHAVQDRHVTCSAAERATSAPSSTPADTAELQQQQQQQLPLASLVSQNCMYWDVQRPHTSTSSSTTMMRNRKGLSHFGQNGDDKQKDTTKTMKAATMIGNPPIEYIPLQSSSECVKGMSTEEIRSRCATWLQEHPSSSSPCAVISQGHRAGTTASSSRHLSCIERTGSGGAETKKVIHPLIEGGRGWQLQTASKRLRSRSLVVEHTLGSTDKATTDVEIGDSRDWGWTANQRSAALCQSSATCPHLPGSACSCRSSVMSSSANPLLMQSSKDGPLTAAAVVPGTVSEVSAGPAVLTHHGSSLHVSCDTTGFQSPTAISPSSLPPMMKQSGNDPRCCKNWGVTDVDKVDDNVAMSESAATDGRTGRRCRPGSETALSHQEREVTAAAAAGMAAVCSMPRGAWRRQQQGKMTVKKRTPDSSKCTIMSSTTGVNAGTALEYCIQDFAALEQQSRQYMSAAGVLSRRTAAADIGL